MIFTQNRDQLRRFYCEVWDRYCAGQALEPLETVLAEIIAQHPEYHALLEDTEAAVVWEFPPELGEANPFLHLALHMAIQEQIAADRPPGVRVIYQRLMARYGEAHETEHRIMECLAESLWHTQRSGVTPDERAYLECLKGLAG
jgi:Domain of unknown function (DUF1841).